MYIVRYSCVPLFSRKHCVVQREEKYNTLREALYNAQAKKKFHLPNGRLFVRSAVTVTFR